MARNAVLLLAVALVLVAAPQPARAGIFDSIGDAVRGGAYDQRCSAPTPRMSHHAGGAAKAALRLLPLRPRPRRLAAPATAVSLAPRRLQCACAPPGPPPARR